LLLLSIYWGCRRKTKVDKNINQLWVAHIVLSVKASELLFLRRAGGFTGRIRSAEWDPGEIGYVLCLCKYLKFCIAKACSTPHGRSWRPRRYLIYPTSRRW
jgi:hypothetical protein